MLGVDGDDLPEDSAGRLRLTAAVQLLTVYAQSAMQGIFTPTPAGAPVVLDDSELTTIRLAKGARTVHQIGEMVSISSAEVQRNLRQVTRKLGVSSVSAAVLRCIKDGLIA